MKGGMKDSMRGQVSSEFMVVYAALLTIFLIVFIIYFGSSTNLFQIQDKTTALRNAQTIAAAMNYVYLAGDGASYNLTLSGIANDENITIHDFSVNSKRSQASASAALLVGDVNDTSIASGGGNIVITNIGGKLYVSR